MTDFPCSHVYHSDAARRVSDTVTQRWHDYGYEGTVGKWMAFQLSDGSSSMEIYPTMEKAQQYNAWEKHFYLVMHPGGMTPCEAEIMILFHRNAREKGFPQGNPDLTGRARKQVLIPRIGRETIAAQIQGLLKGSR